MRTKKSPLDQKMGERKEKNNVMIPARVPFELFKETQKRLKKEGRTWVELVVASLKMYLGK